MTEISLNALANTVSAKGQLEPNRFVTFDLKADAKLRLLIVGNSITRHAPAPHIGWHGNHGMAASCEANDFVHRVRFALEAQYGDLSLCVAQAAEWERRYFEGEAPLDEFYTPARDFAADVVVIRLGENIPRDKNAELPCKPYYAEMVRFFASKNPAARVIVTDNFWKNPALDEAFREVAHENSWAFCPICDLELDERTMAKGLFKHTGVAAHPSDYGMQRIADRIVGAVSALFN